MIPLPDGRLQPVVTRSFPCLRQESWASTFREHIERAEIARRELFADTLDRAIDHIDQDVKVINRIVNGRSAVTAEVALKLAATFSTTPEFWLNAQKAVELFAARSKLPKLPKPLVPGRRPAA